MLDWCTQIISGDNHEDSSSSDHHNQLYNHHYPHAYTDHTQLGFTHPYPTQTHFQNSDPQLITPLGMWPFAHMHQPDPDSTRFIMPKPEPVYDYASHIGLNLGGRTYFSSAENEFVNRLYRGSRPENSLVNVPRCQAEGCGTDLTHAKHYHRRHKVCDFHSKAAGVAVAGITQRFCQQCSRFHLLTEFDSTKRSCRKRLADHNRRRRKNNQANTNNEIALTHSPSDIVSWSPQDSGTPSTSSAISSPRISFDCFGQGSY